MEGFTRNKLLDFIANNEKEWLVTRDEEEAGSTIQKTLRHHGFSEENKLELRLAPPGEDNWSNTKPHNSRERDEPDLLSLGIQKVQKFSQENNHHNNNNISSSGSSSSPWSCSANFLQFSSSSSPSSGVGVGVAAPQRFPVTGKESSQHCSTTAVDILNSENKAFSPSPATTTTAVHNTSQKRGPAPVVGWPPIKSFRKNAASTSYSKPSSSESQKIKPAEVTSDKKPVLNVTSTKGLFVKINMDGIPIGRKVDIKAYDSYEKLASVVDELFRGLLEGQNDPSAEGVHSKPEQKAITGLLDGSGEYTLVYEDNEGDRMLVGDVPGSGEYTLVYEDNEGDRMLVGDVPWHMFVSTVQRLRVLKSSELPAFTRSKQGKMQA